MDRKAVKEALKYKDIIKKFVEKNLNLDSEIL